MSRASTRANAEALANESADTEAIAANEVLTDKNFTVPSHLTEATITRHFAIEFTGALSEFSDSPSLASWSPTELSIFQSKSRYVSKCRWIQFHF